MLVNFANVLNNNFMRKTVLDCFEKLIRDIKNAPCKIDLNLVSKTFSFIYSAYGIKLNPYNEQHLLFSLEVARITTHLGMDTYSIIIALLHNTIENSVISYEDIATSFGSKIADMVKGLTGLNYIEGSTPFISEEQRKNENYRNLLYGASKDIRVLVVKLADRLHNMRILDDLPENQREKVALEAIDIYAPLAEKIGLRDFKEELQDLAFAKLNPKERSLILTQLKSLQKDNKSFIEGITIDLKNMLVKAGLHNIRISGREKKPYSIWKKIQSTTLSFKDISDIFGFRIIANSRSDCYSVLSIVHTAYNCVQEELRDYITLPKTNEYQSLHTIVVTPNGKRIEIQIRTEEMNGIAEFGKAAHWRYKQGEVDEKYNKESPVWIYDVLEIFQGTCSPKETLENVKLKIAYDEIVCFTPKGKSVSMRKGATILDFAFHIHQKTGLKCIAGRINGEIVPIYHKLQSGDRIEIICSNNYQACKK